MELSSETTLPVTPTGIPDRHPCTHCVRQGKYIPNAPRAISFRPEEGTKYVRYIKSGARQVAKSRGDSTRSSSNGNPFPTLPQEAMIPREAHGNTGEVLPSDSHAVEMLKTRKGELGCSGEKGEAKGEGRFAKIHGEQEFEAFRDKARRNRADEDGH